MDISLRKARWRDFIHGNPCVPRLFLIRHDPEPEPRPWPHPDNVADRIEYAWREYERQMGRATWLDDDSLPRLSPYTGTEIFAEAFGCRVYRSDDTMPFALPLIQNASQVAGLPSPDLDTPPLPMVFEIAETLRARGGREALLQLPDIQSPMDIAALIWDKNRFFPALSLIHI